MGPLVFAAVVGFVVQLNSNDGDQLAVISHERVVRRLEADLVQPLQAVVYGVVLIAFVLFEPMGLYGRWLKVRTWLQMFPFYRKGLFKRQKSFQKSDRLK